MLVEKLQADNPLKVDEMFTLSVAVGAAKDCLNAVHDVLDAIDAVC